MDLKLGGPPAWLALSAWAPLFVAATADAGPSARLVYAREPAAASCPDEDALRREVRARVGRDPFLASAKTTVIVRMAASEPRGFIASVSLIDDEGVVHGAREISTRGACTELRDPVALAIAIALDPSLLLRRPGSSPRDDAPAPDAASALPAAAPTEPRAAAVATPTQGLRAASSNGPGSTPARAPATERAPVPLTWEINGGVVGSIGVAPQPAPGLSLGVGLRRDPWSVSVEGRIDATTGRSAPQDEQVTSSLAVVTVVPCWIAWPMRICALAQAGQLDAASHATTQSVLWLAAGARVLTAISLDATTSLGVSSDILVDLRPPTLGFGTKLDIWTAPAVAASFAANVIFHF